MIRHIVNFGLLFAFVGLAVTGVMAYSLPFSITTTRVHVVFGALTLLLVVLHLASRSKYFSAKLKGRSASRKMVALVGLLVGLLAVAALAGWWPVAAALDYGYEARNRAKIVRGSPLAGFLDGDHTRLIARDGGDPSLSSLSLAVRLNDSLEAEPAMAVWAETSTGTMIETLYLDEALAYSERVDWEGLTTERFKLLPIWRHRYTMVSGVEPNGEIDLYSAATPTHSFKLEEYLKEGEEFVLCVEINAVADSNELWSDPELGQPSLLYTAYLEPSAKGGYALLELTAHGGGAFEGGTLQYDFEGFETALDLVDLLLAKVSAKGPAEASVSE